MKICLFTHPDVAKQDNVLSDRTKLCSTSWWRRVQWCSLRWASWDQQQTWKPRPLAPRPGWWSPQPHRTGQENHLLNSYRLNNSIMHYSTKPLHHTVQCVCTVYTSMLDIHLTDAHLATKAKQHSWLTHVRCITSVLWACTVKETKCHVCWSPGNLTHTQDQTHDCEWGQHKV